MPSPSINENDDVILSNKNNNIVKTNMLLSKSSNKSELISGSMSSSSLWGALFVNVLVL
jgi:hypothetical protein